MWNDDSGETCDIIRNTTTSVKSRRPWTSTKMHTYARLLGVWNLEKPECEQKWRKEKKKYTEHWRHKDDIRLEVVAAGRGALFVVGGNGAGAVGIDVKAVVHFLSRLATERARVLRNLARLRGVRRAPACACSHAEYSCLVSAIPAPSIMGRLVLIAPCLLLSSSS